MFRSSHDFLHPPLAAPAAGWLDLHSDGSSATAECFATKTGREPVDGPVMVVSSGENWDSYGFIYMDLYESIWIYMVVQWDLYESIWIYMDLYGGSMVFI